MSSIFLTIPYMLLICVIAMWGNSQAAIRIQQSSLVYVLSLAIYCTAWSFFGNIGLASHQGIQPYALYIGATLGLFILNPMIKRLIVLKNHYHLTSLADVLSARYDRSNQMAALVTLISLLGIVPYLAIQIIAIIHSAIELDLIWGVAENREVGTKGLFIVMTMMIATILLGVRKLDPTERHPGVVLAIAAASIFKLLVLIVVSTTVFFAVFDDLGMLSAQLNHAAGVSEGFKIFQHSPSLPDWFAMMLLGFFGILLLPRQFHVAVVECSNKNHIDKATWQLPVYLLIVNIFIIPITLIGQHLLPDLEQKDMLLLIIPNVIGLPGLSTLVFLGGLAAASSMLIVSTMALSTMTTNHLIVPVIVKYKQLKKFRPFILQIRWFAVVLIMSSSYAYYRVVENNYLLIEIGTISFIAVLQFVPALVAGMYWKQAHFRGAFYGMLAGSLVWFYTALFPTFIKAGYFTPDIIHEGPFGLSVLAPYALFGLDIPPMSHSLFWSLLLNITVLVLFSCLNKEESISEIAMSNQFMGLDDEVNKSNTALNQVNLEDKIPLQNKIELAKSIFFQYLPPVRANEIITGCLLDCELKESQRINVLQLSLLENRLTTKLGGLIGIAASHYAIKSAQLFSHQEEEELTKYYAELLVQLHLTPEELLEKVSFYREKQQLLENHAAQQNNTICKLEEQIRYRQKAELALQELNEKLEVRVVQRTTQLQDTNQELQNTLDQLNATQKQLIEAEKMASLSELVAGLAHELNTPAGNIRTAISVSSEHLESLEDKFKSSQLTKTKFHKFIFDIKQSTDLVENNIIRIVELINYFKLLNVKASYLTPIKFNLYEILNSHIKMRLNDIKNKEINFIFNCSPTLTIISFKDALIQVFDSLLNNSFQHGFKEISSGEITVACSQMRDKIFIEYKDSGCGMNEGELKKLFEPFFTTKRGEGNMGLGAHIIYNLINQKLDGEVEVKSSVGKGVMFQIKLQKEIKDLQLQKVSSH